MENKKRTRIDWGKHELIVLKDKHCTIHHLKRPDTNAQNVRFINTSHVLAVTGDYGNWIFCREFHPGAKGFVSDSYWMEKLRISSTQNISNYSPELTMEAIMERLEEERDDENNADLIEYLENCIAYIDNEHRYLTFAHDEKPDWMDHEDVIFVCEPPFWLTAVFDAFDEICRRVSAAEIRAA